MGKSVRLTPNFSLYISFFAIGLEIAISNWYLHDNYWDVGYEACP